MSTPIIVNGVTYHSIDDMPPDVRAQYEQATAQLADPNRAGMPKILENVDNAAPVVVPTATSPALRDTAPKSEAQNIGPIVLLTVVAFGLLAILAIFMFLLMARAR